MSAPNFDRRNGLALLIFKKFKELGPMTTREVAAALGKRVEFVAPRVTELVYAGSLVASLADGARRSTSGRGRPALVYRVAEAAA